MLEGESRWFLTPARSGNAPTNRLYEGHPSNAVTIVTLGCGKRAAGKTFLSVLCGCSQRSRDKLLPLFFPGHHKLRSPKQSPLDLRIRKATNGLPRRLRISSRPIMRCLNRSVALQNSQNLTMRNAIESPLLKDFLTRSPLIRLAP